MNIAEGCGRKTNADFGHFLQIAAGSASEVEYQLLIARDLGYIDANCCDAMSARIVEIRKMIVAFISSLKTSKPRSGDLTP